MFVWFFLSAIDKRKSFPIPPPHLSPTMEPSSRNKWISLIYGINHKTQIALAGCARKHRCAKGINNIIHKCRCDHPTQCSMPCNTCIVNSLMFAGINICVFETKLCLQGLIFADSSGLVSHLGTWILFAGYLFLRFKGVREIHQINPS